MGWSIVILAGVARCGLVWFGVVWCGLVWFGVVRAEMRWWIGCSWRKGVLCCCCTMYGVCFGLCVSEGLHVLRRVFFLLGVGCWRM